MAVVFATSPPPIAVIGTAFPVVVALHDENGSVVSSATDSVTVFISGFGPPMTCNGGETKAAVAGVATFSCTINQPVVDARLAAVSGSLSVIGPFFSVTNAGTDANCDLSVNGTDAQAVLRALAGLSGGTQPTAPCTGDANGSQSLDIDDVRRIRMAAAGL